MFPHSKRVPGSSPDSVLVESQKLWFPTKSIEMEVRWILDTKLCVCEAGLLYFLWSAPSFAQSSASEYTLLTVSVDVSIQHMCAT